MVTELVVESPRWVVLGHHALELGFDARGFQDQIKES